MRHFILHRVVLELAGFALWIAAASTPAWSGFPDWHRYLEIINPTSATFEGTVQGYSADLLPTIVVLYYDVIDHF